MPTYTLYWKLVSVAIRSHMQHRVSFLLLCAAQFLSASMDIFCIWALFTRFKTVEGWCLTELALLYGIVHMSFSTAEVFGRGFEKFSSLLRYGPFDILLLRPLGTLFQVATREIQPLKVGRFLQGFLVFLWGFSSLSFSFFSIPTLLLFFSFLGTTALFYGVFIIQATCTFWLLETTEILHTITYGSRETGQYPIGVYNWAFRFFFTCIIPLACVLYYPIATLLHHESLPLLLGLFMPFLGFLFLFLSCKLWNCGVRHYRSTGN